MKTTLPNLPYNPEGFSWSDDNQFHLRQASNVSTNISGALHPMGYICCIRQAIDRMTAMNIAAGTEYDFVSMDKKRPVVESEHGVHV